MNSDLIFQLSNNAALVSWMLLIFFPKKKWVLITIPSVVVSLLCLLYSYLLLSSFSISDIQRFSSLVGVTELFKSPAAVLAGWVHYLAFDLLVGLYIVTNATKHSISHWLCIPCLLFTFLAGPVGLLMFFILKVSKTKTILHSLN